MRSLPFFFFLLSACDLPPFENDIYPAPAPERAAWWGGLPQDDRERRILERAQTDDGRYVAETCKEWARTVVIDASRGAANLPATCRYEAGEWKRDLRGWYWCPSLYVTHLPIGIQEARSGMLVQMLRHDTGPWYPHTAIVLARTAGGIRWIESNRHGTETVAVHDETIEEFERATCARDGCFYSIYQVSKR